MTKEFYEGAKIGGSKNGDKVKCPYPFGSKQALDWMTGYNRASDLSIAEDEIGSLSHEEFMDLTEPIE